MRPGFLASLVLLTLPLTPVACGSQPGPPGKGPIPAGAALTCPPPIGTIAREDCGEIADDFGAFTVSGALKVAGAGREAELRVEAIKAAESLAATIKEQRVGLCQDYGKCKVSVADRDAQDQLLAGAMRALIALWGKRNFSRTDQILAFRDGVRAIAQKVTPGGDPAVAAPRPPHTYKADEVLERVEDPQVAFKIETGSITVSSAGEGKHDALRVKPDAISLPGGHRYRVRVTGRYAPAAPPLFHAGDELTARLHYRASAVADLSLALRSLEDPEASESTDAWKAAPGDKGAHESKLTADPQSTGFWLGVGVRGAPVDLGEIEILRGGKVIATSRAEAPGEPGVKSECAADKQRPLAGKPSWRCAPGEGDRITIGKPEGYLVITVRDAGGERGAVRTLSLEGGRSVDAALTSDGQVIFTLMGKGSATIERLEVSDLGGN